MCLDLRLLMRHGHWISPCVFVSMGSEGRHQTVQVRVVGPRSVVDLDCEKGM
jgi:hypothetical protein